MVNTMNLNTVISIGIDFGNTLTHRPNGSKHPIPFPDAVRVVKALSSLYPCHIISKVNAQQKIDVLTFLTENNFLEQLGIPESNLHFCEERHQKNAICLRLGVTHHIDDRPEVVANLDDKITSFLFRPVAEDVVKFFHILKRKDVSIVQNWNELEKQLRYHLPSL